MQDVEKWKCCYPTIPNGVVWVVEIIGPWWDMVGKKEEFWRNKQNSDFPGKTFLKGDFLPFSTNIYFGKNVLKRDFLQRPIYGKKIYKPYFLLTRALDVFENIQGLWKIIKFSLFFFNKSYRGFKQSFTKQKPILLFSIRIEFSKANKVLLKIQGV